MRATAMHAAGDVRVENVPDARLIAADSAASKIEVKGARLPAAVLALSDR
jgi:hypothetical protein